MNLLKDIEQKIRNLEEKIFCCPLKIEFKNQAGFNTPGKNDTLYVNTTDYKIYIWDNSRYSYTTYDQGIRLFQP